MTAAVFLVDIDRTSIQGMFDRHSRPFCQLMMSASFPSAIEVLHRREMTRWRAGLEPLGPGKTDDFDKNHLLHRWRRWPRWDDARLLVSARGFRSSCLRSTRSCCALSAAIPS